MDILTLFLIFVAIEIFESNWQKSESLYGLITNNYAIYQRNILVYFLLNGSFFYALFLSISTNNFSFMMLSVIALKFLDISFKISLMQKLSKGITLEEIMPNVKITFLLRYLNVLIYPFSYIISTNYFN